MPAILGVWVPCKEPGLSLGVVPSTQGVPFLAHRLLPLQRATPAAPLAAALSHSGPRLDPGASTASSRQGGQARQGSVHDPTDPDAPLSWALSESSVAKPGHPAPSKSSHLAAQLELLFYLLLQEAFPEC